MMIEGHPPHFHLVPARLALVASIQALALELCTQVPLTPFPFLGMAIEMSVRESGTTLQWRQLQTLQC